VRQPKPDTVPKPHLPSETNMNFLPHTAIEIPRRSGGLIAADKISLAQFWDRVEVELETGLSGAIGCYIFSVRAGKGVLPWYVGLAEKQSFKKECFTSHKLVHYNNVVSERKGTPLLTLVSKYTPGGKLLNPTGNSHRDIQFLEALLIANCMARNGDLYNKRDTKLLREMVVPGLLNTAAGKSPSSVVAFRNLVGG
jgi:hypothetical protein